MIDNITNQDLRQLAEATSAQSVSIFLPTHRTGPERAQDPLRLKNLLSEAADELVSLGRRQPEADALLAPATALLDEQDFWAHQDNGLAVYLTDDGMTTFRVPELAEEMVVVSDRFHLKPLLPSVAGTRSFSVLVLSQHEARLLRGSRVHVAEIELSAGPEVADQGHRSEPSPARSVGRGRVATFQGHRGPSEFSKDDLTRFLSSVDDGINRILPDPPVPVVLAGQAHVVAAFRHASRYPRILDRHIEGDPEQLSLDELYARAWPIVESILDRDRADATDVFLAAATPKTSLISAAVLAAGRGQVDTLFVPIDAQEWGTIAPDQQQVDVHDVRQPGDCDLLDCAAIDTILHHGAVFTIPANEIPGDGSLAAVLRY